MARRGRRACNVLGVRPRRTAARRMTTYSLTLLESQYAAIRAVTLADNRERGILLLCGRSTYVDPWTGAHEERLVGREVVEVDENQFLERRFDRMTWSTTPFYKL